MWFKLNSMKAVFKGEGFHMAGLSSDSGLNTLDSSGIIKELTNFFKESGVVVVGGFVALMVLAKF